MALSKIRTFFDAIFNSEEYEDTGKAGERFTYRVIKDRFWSSEILRNVYLTKDNGKSTEIDLLAVGSRGIYVFESKNYSGSIYGDEQRAKWTQYLNGGTKYQIYNPIRQNQTHIGALQKHLSAYPNIVYFNIVVFSERCKLKIGEISLPNTYVVKRDELDRRLGKIVDDYERTIPEQQQKEIIRLLSAMSRPEETVKEQHIQQVKEDLSKCPFCGGELVERTNKKTGDSFLGCKGYPKCKFTRQAAKI